MAAYFRSLCLAMEQIEFLDRTDYRHMQTHIKFKIKDYFHERELDVDRRRACLQALLAAEELQQQQELAFLVRERVLENQRKRLDWIATAKFQEKEAEREFVKLKNLQRELENCEEMRPQKSKKITEETKRAQLSQIAEKREHQLREKAIDQIWHEVMLFMEAEREQQQQYEERLKKLIAQKDEQVLRSQAEYREYLKGLEKEEKRVQAVEDLRAKNEDIIKADNEARREQERKVAMRTRQLNELQAAEDERIREAETKVLIESKYNELDAIRAKKEEEAVKAVKAQEKEHLEKYMQYVKANRSEMNCRDKMLDTALTSFNRRRQTNAPSKVPYQKSVR